MHWDVGLARVAALVSTWRRRSQLCSARAMARSRPLSQRSHQAANTCGNTHAARCRRGGGVSGALSAPSVVRVCARVALAAHQAHRAAAPAVGARVAEGAAPQRDGRPGARAAVPPRPSA